MRNRSVVWLGAVTLGAAGLSLALGQAPPPKSQPQQTQAPGANAPGSPGAPPRPLPSSVAPASYVPPVGAAAPDLFRLSPLAQQLGRSARSGAEWLFRVHQLDGHFLPGWHPDLNEKLDSDHFLRQAGATLTLARAARYFKDEKYATRARQAVLTLLAQTGPDPSDPQSRCTILPSAVVSRLGAAGLVLAAIHELPDPTKDLLDQGEQLARFIVRQQQPDGSFRYTDAPDEIADPDGVHHYPGMALYGLMRSQTMRPAPAKIEAARRALGYYRAYWREHRHPAFVVWQVPAFAETCLLSKTWTRDGKPDPAYAAFVYEMCDWLCPLQHTERNVQMMGGFPEFAQGKPAPEAPKATGAAYAAALVEACRVTRQLPDADRYTRYRDAARRTLQFVTTLQYTEANTQHFTSAYRQQILLGGFHTSHEDGTLRLDCNQHAVGALVQYLAHLANLPES